MSADTTGFSDPGIAPDPGGTFGWLRSDLMVWLIDDRLVVVETNGPRMLMPRRPCAADIVQEDRLTTAQPSQTDRL